MPSFLKMFFYTISILVVFAIGGCASKSVQTIPPQSQVQEQPDGKKVTFLYQSNRLGVVEPCGCHTTPYGGLDREANAVAEMRKLQKNVFYVDAGNTLTSREMRSGLKNSKRRAKNIAQMLEIAGLDIFSPGPVDYQLGVDFLKSLAKDRHFKFISSNVVDKKGKPLFSPYVIENRDGVNFAFLSLTPPLKEKGVRVEDPKATLQKWLPVLEKKSDVIVLLSQLPKAENEKIAENQPTVKLIIGGDPMVTLDEPYWFSAHSLLVDPAENGFLLGKLQWTLRLPFKGFYSNKAVDTNQRELRDWEERLKQNPNDSIARSYIERIKQYYCLEEIAGGTSYSHELMPLRKEWFGSPNQVTQLIVSDKEEVRKSALNE